MAPFLNNDLVNIETAGDSEKQRLAVMVQGCRRRKSIATKVRFLYTEDIEH